MREGTVREIDHTADLGIEVEADTAEEVFRQAGLALFDFMVGPENVEIREEREVCVEAEGWEDLLHAWLSRLLQVFLVDGFIAKTIQVTDLGHARVKACLAGEPLDLDRHDFRTEIKAVTYHQLTLARREGGGWYARVIFDV